MSIKDVRKETDFTQKEFADYFDVSVRSVQNWEIERVNPPQGMERMMRRILFLEKRLRVLKPDYIDKIGGDSSE